MKKLTLLMFICLQAQVSYGQSSTGNIRDNSSYYLADVGRNTVEYTAPQAPEGASSCRIWIKGNFDDDQTLFSNGVNAALLAKGYLPLQRGNHRIRFTASGLTATYGAYDSSLFTCSIEHHFAYNWDHPVQNDLLLDLDYIHSHGRSHVFIKGNLSRFGERIVLMDDMIRATPDQPNRSSIHPGVLIGCDQTDLKTSWLGGKYTLGLDGGQINPNSQNGYSRKFRKAFLKLIEEMPRCDQIPPKVQASQKKTQG